MSTAKLVSTLAWVVALLGPPAALASPIGSEFGPNLVSNGGFETGNFIPQWTQSGDTGFTEVSGSAPLGAPNFVPHTGSFGAFFGPADDLGFISQDLVTIPGASYNIRFWLRSVTAGGNDPTNQVTVGWGGGPAALQLDNVPFGDYVEIVIDPIAQGASTALTFGFTNNPGYFYLDDISVRQAPEPASLALLGLGLAGLAMMRRKVA